MALAVVVLACGLAISLGIELIQIRLPGRCSSLYDLLANGLGMLGGIATYLMEIKFSSAKP
jgi:VanZ family protein